MSFDSIEQSQQDAAPVYLYRFIRGGTTWRYVSLPFAVTALGFSWGGSVISHGNINQSSDVPKDQVTITVPINDPMAFAMLQEGQDFVTKVSIWEGHYDALTSSVSDFRVIWSGRVLNGPASVAEIQLKCEPRFTSLRRLGPCQVYQKTCRHRLYERGCFVDRTLYAQTVTIVGISGVTVTVSAPLTTDFIKGNIKASDGTLRMIVGQTSTTLTLMRSVAQLNADMAANPSGFSATVYPGCDKSTTTCRDVYHNLGNFWGEPGIKNGINPMSGSTSVF